MLVPVRCFECGFPVGSLWEEYQEKKSLQNNENEPEKAIMDSINIKRSCCRRILQTHIDMCDELLRFACVDDSPGGRVMPGALDDRMTT
jgi:DNA-directed RNA polymerase subunit N (RpoN/RPB10)